MLMLLLALALVLLLIVGGGVLFLHVVLPAIQLKHALLQK